MQEKASEPVEGILSFPFIYWELLVPQTAAPSCCCSSRSNRCRGGEQPGISAQGRKELEGEASPAPSPVGWSGWAGSWDILERDKQGALSLPGGLKACVCVCYFRDGVVQQGLNWLFLTRPGGKNQECKAASPSSSYSCLLCRISCF